MKPMQRLILIAIAVMVTILPTRAQMDFGDHSSETLTSKAWDALNNGEINNAIGYARKCIDMYAGKAREMQASLSGYPPNDPPEETTKYWALNDVGTCYFILGQAYLQRGDKTAAREAFETSADDFGYAQCWDPKGWFWKPAEAARQKAVELEFDAEDWPDS